MPSCMSVSIASLFYQPTDLSNLLLQHSHDVWPVAHRPRHNLHVDAIVRIIRRHDLHDFPLNRGKVSVV